MASMENSQETGASVAMVSAKVQSGVSIIGFRNITNHAGASSLIYMLRKELGNVYGQDNVVGIEVDSGDFQMFNDRNMVSCKGDNIQSTIGKFPNASIILVDLNQYKDDTFCGDVIYLLEPSTIKLNKLIRRNPEVFQKLANCKVVLNQSLLLNNDVSDFEREAGIKVFYNMPPLDDRKRNAILNDFLMKLGLLSDNNNQQSGGSNRIFGLFRR